MQDILEIYFFPVFFIPPPFLSISGSDVIKTTNLNAKLVTILCCLDKNMSNGILVAIRACLFLHIDVNV